MTATLLASLFTVIAASTALAAVSVTGTQTVPRGGTSTGSPTFTFTENSANCFPNAGANPALVYTITTPGVTFTGTPVITRPDSLGASVTFTSTSFSIKTLGQDPANVEQMTVTGLKLKATTSAPLGTITATLTGDATTLACVLGTTTATGTLGTQVNAGATPLVSITVTSPCPFADTSGTSPGQATFVTGGPDGRNLTATTALSAGVQTATFSAGLNIHTIGQTVNQTVPACGSTFSPGTVVDAVIQETGVPANVVPGEQNQPATNTSIRELTPGYIPVGTLTFTLSAAGVQFSASPTVSWNSTSPVLAPGGLTATPSTTGGTLAAGTYCYEVTTVTGAGETTPSAGACATTTGATGSVVLNWTAAVGAVTYNVYGRPATTGGVFGLLGNTAGLTFTDTNAGAPGAAPPVVGTAGSAPNLFAAGNVCNLSFDRMSCSVAVTHVSVGLVTLTLSNINLDVASTVAPGTAVNVTVTSSPAIAVAVDTNTIANVARVIVGTAAQPIIYINFNDQATGMVTLIEQAAGYFQSGSGPNNKLTICITTGESFTRAPYAVVTAGTGLQFLSGLVGATSVLGTLLNLDPDGVGGFGVLPCAQWTVFTASTAAATIEIRGSDSAGAVLPSGALNGPRVSVPGTLRPGTTQMALYSGNGGTNQAFLGLVSNATRAYKSDVVVTAASQPTIAKGSVSGPGGDVIITETLNGQFKPGQVICLQIQPRSSNHFIQDTWFDVGGGVSTSRLPVITTNAASGLLVSSVFIGGSPACGGGLSDARALASFTVNQQSFGGTLGVITISNIHYTVAADAPDGNVQLRVWSTSGVGVQFSTFITNARIGVAAGPADAWIARGRNVRAASAFSLATAIVTRGNFVTVRARTTNAGPGTLCEIWVKTRTTAWRVETHRRVSTNGYMYYSGRVLNRGYRYYRVVCAGATSNTVRGFGR